MGPRRIAGDASRDQGWINGKARWPVPVEIGSVCFPGQAGGTAWHPNRAAVRLQLLEQDQF